MAQLLIINSETEKTAFQWTGDVVGIFPDSHQFSETELVKFDVLVVNGSVADVQARLDQIKPREENACLWVSDGKYHWVKSGVAGTDKWIVVFQVEGSNKWYKLVNDFKFAITVKDLTQQEKDFLVTLNINHPSVDSFIRKIAKDIASDPANEEEVKDLKNSEPATIIS